MCEPAIHELRSVFTRLVQQNLFASVATLRVLFFCVSDDWRFGDFGSFHNQLLVVLGIAFFFYFSLFIK